MRSVDAETGSTTSEALRARVGTARLLRVCALGLVVCAARSPLSRAQGATAAHDSRPTIGAGQTMSGLNTADATLGTRAPRAAPGDTTIRPFRIHVSEAPLADLRRRIQATRWPDKETVEDR